MRAVLLTILTFGGLFGGFVLYTRLAAPPARAPVVEVAATESALNSVTTTQPTVAQPWVNLYDKDGQFYGRLRAATCVPTPDGMYHLTKPEAEFFQSGGAPGERGVATRDGTIVVLTAGEGDVALGDPNRHTNIGSGPVDPPSKGILHDVTVSLYPDKEARDAGQADIVGRLPNAQFNADTYQIYTTEQADAATGQTTPADQIPVSMRGRDMDLDGRGLMLYWDGEKHELKSLLIIHGERLTLKKTTTSAGQAAVGSAAPPAADPPGSPAAPAKPGATASRVQPGASGKPTVATSPAPAGRNDPIYLATFNDNVRVVQGDQTPVTTDSMEVALNPRGEKSPATLGQGQGGAVAKGANAGGRGDHSSSAGAGQAAAGNVLGTPIEPAGTASTLPPSRTSSLLPTGSSSQPVEIFWTGKLTVVPDLNPNDRVAPGQQIIRFTGTTHVHQGDVDMVGGRARYDTTTGAARMFAGETEPLKMTLFRAGTNIVAGTLFGQRVDFTPDSTRRNATAKFTGAGKANFAARSDSPQAAENSGEIVRAAWQQECDVSLTTPPAGSLYVQRTVLIGDAMVADAIPGAPDKLHLTAQTITADFDPPPARAANKANRNSADATGSSAGPLRTVVARGNALCIVHDGKDPDRALATDLLTVQTATDSLGKPYPKFIIADGNVRGAQGEQRFSSRHLDVTLAPPAPKTVGAQAGLAQAGGGNANPAGKTSQLQMLLATGDVDLIGANGDRAQGDTLTVDQRNGPGEQFLTLLGSPRAIITGPDGVLRAGHIEAKPKQHWARIVGPGVIDAISAAQPGQKPRPMHVEWKDSAEITPIAGHDDENLIQVHGNVLAETHGTSEGKGPTKLTRDEATSDNAELVLTPAPATPTAKAKQTATTDDSLDLFKGKQIQTATLIDHAAVTSTVLAGDETLLSRAFITGNRILTNMPQQTMNVPGPGQMLLEEHEKPGASAASSAGPSPTSGRGATGFWWTKSFSFDDHSHQAVIDGSVIIKHINDPKAAAATKPSVGGRSKQQAAEPAKPDSTTILADHVVADFEPAPSQPAMTAGQLQDAPLTLKQLTATGNVEIRAGSGALAVGSTAPQGSGATIDCSTAIYDKVKEELTAIGTPSDPVRVYSNVGARQAAFGQVVIDARTNMVKSVSDFTGVSR